MRKTLTALLAFGLIAGLVAAPAAAGTKTVKKSWTATAPTPLPHLGENGGCIGEGSTEDVHKDTFTFKTPSHRKTGTLSVRIDGFTGDWDLFVFKGQSRLGESTSDNLSQDYEAVSGIRLKGKTTVQIVACNWSGGPTANGSLVYKYKK